MKIVQLFFVLRIFICILAAGLTLFGYIEKQNELTELRLAIPSLAKEVKSLQEENIRLTYEIEHFESPIHLMELMRKPEFSRVIAQQGSRQEILAACEAVDRGIRIGENTAHPRIRRIDVLERGPRTHVRRHVEADRLR